MCLFTTAVVTTDVHIDGLLQYTNRGEKAGGPPTA